MSYSAQTEKLRLPQWVQGSKDHPDFLTDVNQAFEKIDGFAQGIDNTVDGLPEQVEEIATILQSVQEDVGEHTEELARQGVRIGVLETGMAEVNGLDSRVAALEDGQREQDEGIDALEAFKEFIIGKRTSSPSVPFYKVVDGNLDLNSRLNMEIRRNGNVCIAVFLRDHIVNLAPGAYHYQLKAAEDYKTLMAQAGVGSNERIEWITGGYIYNANTPVMGHIGVGEDRATGVVTIEVLIYTTVTTINGTEIDKPIGVIVKRDA